MGTILKLLGWIVAVLSLAYAGLGALNVGGDPSSGFWHEMLLAFALFGIAVGGGLIALGAMASRGDS